MRSPWLDHLNPEQREAVATTDGPLLVLAGAGSGKTRVITHRIAHLMHGGVPAENILAVTFTNRAAGEMRARLRAMIGKTAEAVTMGTFHALGLSILRRELARQRRKSRFTVFDTGDQLGCLREITRYLRFERNLDLGAILSRISALKNAFVDPGDVPEAIEGDDYAEATRLLYPRYVEQLHAYAAYDFDDLICEPVRRLERREETRRRWSEQFRYILVDEYQDTNAAQFRLLRALGGEHRNVCVVGDDDQSIYGWRGAEVRNILGFERDFPGAKVVYLLRNYRSRPAILGVANAVIAENEMRHPKQLASTRPEGQRVRMVVAEDGDAEANFVAREIRRAIDDRRYRPQDIAILYRSNLFSRGIETELRAAGVRYRVIGGTSFYESKEVKDYIAYLRVCCNPADEVSLRRVINTPARGIGPRTVGKLTEAAEEAGKPLFWACENAGEILGPTEQKKAATLRDFAGMLRSYGGLRQTRRGLPSRARELLDSSGLIQDIDAGAPSVEAAHARQSRLHGLLDGLEGYTERAKEPSLPEFLGRLAISSSDREEDADNDGLVTLCTLHGAKGLEYPLVFLMGLEEGLLPHDRTLNPQITDTVVGDISEERRLCYVGITRAMDELFLSRAEERVVRGHRKKRTPSRFLGAIPSDLLETEDLSAPATDEEVRGFMADIWAKLGD